MIKTWDFELHLEQASFPLKYREVEEGKWVKNSQGSEKALENECQQLKSLVGFTEGVSKTHCIL